MRAKRFQSAIVISCIALMTPTNALALRLVALKTVTPADQQRLYKQLMVQTIEHIDGVCSLTHRQKRKLTVAAKGAIDRAMTKWKTVPPRPQLGRVNRGFLIAPQVQNIGRVVGQQNVVKVLNEPRLATRRTVGQENSVMNESIWTTTLAKVLTAEQASKLNTSKKSRPAPAQALKDQQLQHLHKVLAELKLPPKLSAR